MLTVDMVRAGARRHRDRVAIRHGDRSLTFRQADEAATESELTAHVRALIAGYKVPKRLEFVPAIPTSGVGKILRRELRDPLWAGVERAR